MAWTAVSTLAAGPVVRDVRSGRSEAWINTALRTKSPVLQDVLAMEVRPGSTAERLKADLTANVETDLPAMDAAASAGALGTVWAASAENLATMVAGHRLLRSVIAAGASSVLVPRQRQIFAQAAYLLAEFADVELALREFHDIPADVRQYLETDLLHPGHGTADVATWQRALSAPFLDAGLPPLSVRLDAATLFDGLGAEAPAASDGPKVTVVMPCYRPDLGLLTSVGSILDQSHANLEVLLVDDASGPDYTDLFERCEALDERVRLIRMPENGGTYLARNAALREATGDLVTVQDADDWSHPSRIAEQVRVLVSHPDAGGSRSDAVRATDELVHQWIGYSARRRNASSLMFRRADVERTGPFDAVRKGADSEFHERLVRLIGPVVDTRTPLAVTRLRSGTLSRSDFSYRWMSPDRQLYRAAYRSWHRTLKVGNGDEARVGSVEHRPFPAPRSFVRGVDDKPALELDLLLVFDASRPAAAQAAIDIAHSCGGLRVGAVHLEDATRGRVHLPEPVDLLLAAARSGSITMFSQNDRIAATTTVVLTPRVLELVPVPAPKIVTERVLGVANPPSAAEGVMDFLAASDGARSLTGLAPEWTALDERSQRSWSEAGWELPLLAEALNSTHPALTSNESHSVPSGVLG